MRIPRDAALDTGLVRVRHTPRAPTADRFRHGQARRSFGARGFGQAATMGGALAPTCSNLYHTGASYGQSAALNLTRQLHGRAVTEGGVSGRQRRHAPICIDRRLLRVPRTRCQTLAVAHVRRTQRVTANISERRCLSETQPGATLIGRASSEARMHLQASVYLDRALTTNTRRITLGVGRGGTSRPGGSLSRATALREIPRVSANILAGSVLLLSLRRTALPLHRRRVRPPCTQ